MMSGDLKFADRHLSCQVLASTAQRSGHAKLWDHLLRCIGRAEQRPPLFTPRGWRCYWCGCQSQQGLLPLHHDGVSSSAARNVFFFARHVTLYFLQCACTCTALSDSTRFKQQPAVQMS
jgi:hypothetical protein